MESKAQQWISARLDGGCPKRPKVKVWVKTQQSICCQTLPPFAKRSKLVFFSHLIFHDRYNLTTDPALRVQLTLHARSSGANAHFPEKRQSNWWTGLHYAVGWCSVRESMGNGEWGMEAWKHGSIVDAVVHRWPAHDKPPTIWGWYKTMGMMIISRHGGDSRIHNMMRILEWYWDHFWVIWGWCEDDMLGDEDEVKFCSFTVFLDVVLLIWHVYEKRTIWVNTD